MLFVLLNKMFAIKYKSYIIMKIKRKTRLNVKADISMKLIYFLVSLIQILKW